MVISRKLRAACQRVQNLFQNQWW